MQILRNKMNKRIVTTLFSTLIILSAAAVERKYYDAQIIGIFQGNPSKVYQTFKSSEGTENASFTFNQDGSIANYRGRAVINTLRNEQNRLVSFELLGSTGEYLVSWDRDLITCTKERSPFTKKFSDDFVEIRPKNEVKNGYIYPKNETVTANVKDKDNKKRNVTLYLRYYQNPAFDEYGNIKHCVISYSNIGLGGDDTTFKQTIEYWPDLSVASNSNIPERRDTFKKMIFQPNGFVYDSWSKKNLYDQLFREFVNDPKIKYVVGEHRSKFYGPGGTFFGIPYTAYLWGSVGYGHYEFGYEFIGTLHEIKALEAELKGYLENLGCHFNFKSDSSTSSSKCNILIGTRKKNKLMLTEVSIQPFGVSGTDNGGLTLTLHYEESKM